MLQNATLLRKSAPWPPNISEKHVFCTALVTRHASFQILFTCPTSAIVFWKVQNPLRLPRKIISEPSKLVRACGAFNNLTWKCASRHNGVHFFDMSTSKSGPRMVWFVHFDLQMCFAAQRRALFRHLNFQKWSEDGVVCTFWLGDVLRATTACTFSTSQLPKVFRSWCVLYILTCKCASRHNGVHFFDITTSKSAPKLRCFVTFWLRNVFRATTALACNFSSLIWLDGSPPAALASLLFDPPESGATNHWKNIVFRLLSPCFFWLSLLWSSFFFSSLLFSSLSSLLFSSLLFSSLLFSSLLFSSLLFSSLLFSSLLFSSLLFSSLPFSSRLVSSLLFSDSSHLCFSPVHIVGSLTSKLPSVIAILHMGYHIGYMVYLF